MSLERRARAAALFEDTKSNGKNIDALLVTSLHNCRYLSGFTGSNAAMLLYKSGDAVLYTDPRYMVQAAQQTDCRVVIASGKPITTYVLKELAKKRPRKLGIESDHMDVTHYEALKKGIPEKVSLVPVSGLIETLRMVKDIAEIATIRQAVNANSKALEQALANFKPGITEAEFAAEIDYQNRKLGAEAPAFDTIVATGIRSALPHAHPGPTKVENGILLIDMGAFHNGYSSDMTRTVHIGAAPAKFKKAYKAVLEAQLAAVDAVRPGRLASAVDQAARSVLKGYGLDKEFVHSTGHGLGLQIHEPPRLGQKDKTKLVTGMTITVEPGIYLEGWGGIRIEDTVLVTETGVEILTPGSKELRVF